MPNYAITSTPEAFDPAVHVRDDMLTLDLTIEQLEGDFAVARLTIVNPRGPLPGEHILISDKGVLIFRGQINQAAVGRMEERLDIEAIGRTQDYENKRATLLQSLKVSPFYDPLFVAPEERDNQSEILTGHGKVLAWSRLTGDVQAVDPLGGATTIELHPLKGTIREDLDTGVPSTVVLNLSVEWSQLCSQFYTAGSELNNFETLTPDALAADWPTVGQSIGSSFEVSFTEFRPQTSRATLLTHVAPPDPDELDLSWAAAAEVPREALLTPVEASLTVAHRYDVRRVENITLTLSAGVQPVLGNLVERMPAIRLQDITQDTDIPAWSPDTDYKQGDLTIRGTRTFEALEDHRSGSFFRRSLWRDVGESPAVSSRRTSSFFSRTVRGRVALEHALERMRARLRFAARSARIRFRCEMPDNPNALNENCMATVVHAGLPGGQATGRVVYYSLTWSGIQRMCEVEVAFALGDETGSETVTFPDPTGNIIQPVGDIRVELLNANEEQAEEFVSSGRISPTEVVVRTSPAPMEEVQQTVETTVDGVLQIPRQLDWVPVA